MAGAYRPRHPEQTVLYRVMFHHFEREYGFLRPIVKEVVERHLDCGNPRCGFARIRCPDCAEERRLLKPGGFVAVTEISWLKPNPPEAAYRFWNKAYPAMATVEENLAGLSAAHLNGHSKLGGTT